jgi:hypothetical protein
MEFILVSGCYHLLSMSESKFSLSAKDIQRLRDDYLIPFRDAKKAQRTVVVKEAYTTLIKNRTILHANRSMVKQVRVHINY